MREDFQFDIRLDERQYKLLQNHEPFAGEPYYVVVQLERFGFSSGVQPAQSSRSKKLLGQHDRQAQDLVQHRGQKRGLEAGRRSEVAKGLLVNFGGGHPQSQRRRVYIGAIVAVSHGSGVGRQFVKRYPQRKG